MTITKLYSRIADRALVAADRTLAAQVHENAAFFGYHAFESLGGALCHRNGKPYPFVHKKKIKVFVHEAKYEKYAKHVAELAIAYGSLRNALLYPIVRPGGCLQEPIHSITHAQATRLVGRTKSLAIRVQMSI